MPLKFPRFQISPTKRTHYISFSFLLLLLRQTSMSKPRLNNFDFNSAKLIIRLGQAVQGDELGAICR